MQETPKDSKVITGLTEGPGLNLRMAIEDILKEAHQNKRGDVQERQYLLGCLEAIPRFRRCRGMEML